MARLPLQDGNRSSSPRCAGRAESLTCLSDPQACPFSQKTLTEDDCFLYHPLRSWELRLTQLRVVRAAAVRERDALPFAVHGVDVVLFQLLHSLNVVA